MTLHNVVEGGAFTHHVEEDVDGHHAVKDSNRIPPMTELGYQKDE